MRAHREKDVQKKIRIEGYMENIEKTVKDEQREGGDRMWGMIATWRMAAEGVEKGAGMLKAGGDAGDAIETAIREVEDFPYYKSVGYGGLPNEEMEVELDAAYMDGDTLDIGAVVLGSGREDDGGHLHQRSVHEEERPCGGFAHRRLGLLCRQQGGRSQRYRPGRGLDEGVYLL